MVLALNMMDEVRANGGTVNVKKLSESLGIPVIPISAAKTKVFRSLRIKWYMSQKIVFCRKE